MSVAGESDRPPVTEATVKLRVGDAVVHTVAEGDGPVNAPTAHYGKHRTPFPRLVGDAPGRLQSPRHQRPRRYRRAVRVVIESKDHDAIWGTVGVSENVIEASWLALVDAFDHKLAKDARAVQKHPVLAHS